MQKGKKGRNSGKWSLNLKLVFSMPWQALLVVRTTIEFCHGEGSMQKVQSIPHHQLMPTLLQELQEELNVDFPECTERDQNGQ